MCISAVLLDKRSSGEPGSASLVPLFLAVFAWKVREAGHWDEGQGCGPTLNPAFLRASLRMRGKPLEMPCPPGSSLR